MRPAAGADGTAAFDALHRPAQSHSFSADERTSSFARFALRSPRPIEFTAVMYARVGHVVLPIAAHAVHAIGNRVEATSGRAVASSPGTRPFRRGWIVAGLPCR
jgi:hypothetical protein